MDKKVSILLPVYNVEKYLNRCMDSILNQTYENLEIILVDDCSEDNSLNICLEYAEKDNRIKVIKKEEHTNAPDVRNVGLDNATGDYIMFVDSDDYVENNFVEEMVKAIEEKNVDVVKCKGIWYNKYGETRIDSFMGNEGRTYRGNQIKDAITSFCTNMNYNIWALIIKKSSLKTRFNTNVYTSEDKVFMIELLLNVSSFYLLDKALYHYYYNNGGITNSKNNYSKYCDGVISADEIIKNMLDEKHMLDDSLKRAIHSCALVGIYLKTYSIMDKPFKEIVNDLKDVFNNKRLEPFLKDIDYSILSIRQKVKHFLCKNKLYLLLTIYLKIDFIYVKRRKLI